MMKFDRAFIDFVYKNQNEDTYSLLLQRDRYPHFDLSDVARCIDGRKKLTKKLPSWAAHADVLIPDPVMVEQASTQETALYKTRLVPKADSTILDMSGGLGVDTSLFATATQGTVHYLERNPERTELARHNFSVMGYSNITTHQGDAEVEGLHLIRTYHPDLVFVDPDRRPGESRQRSFLIEESSPDMRTLLPQIFESNPDTEVLIKLSPMIDIAYIESIWGQECGIHIVSLQRECKELLVHIAPRCTDIRGLHIVELQREHTYLLRSDRTNERVQSRVSPQVGKYLYDLYPSVAKAGIDAFPEFAAKVTHPHEHTHLFFSEELIPDFPGRKFEVIESLPWRKQLTSRLKGQKFNVVVKNLPTSPEAFIKTVGIKEGGESRFLFLYASGDKADRHLIIAHRLS